MVLPTQPVTGVWWGQPDSMSSNPPLGQFMTRRRCSTVPPKSVRKRGKSKVCIWEVVGPVMSLTFMRGEVWVTSRKMVSAVPSRISHSGALMDGVWIRPTLKQCPLSELLTSPFSPAEAVDASPMVPMTLTWPWDSIRLPRWTISAMRDQLPSV